MNQRKVWVSRSNATALQVVAEVVRCGVEVLGHVDEAARAPWLPRFPLPLHGHDPGHDLTAASQHHLTRTGGLLDPIPQLVGGLAEIDRWDAHRHLLRMTGGILYCRQRQHPSSPNPPPPSLFPSPPPAPWSVEGGHQPPLHPSPVAVGPRRPVRLLQPLPNRVGACLAVTADLADAKERSLTHALTLEHGEAVGQVNLRPGEQVEKQLRGLLRRGRNQAQVDDSRRYWRTPVVDQLAEVAVKSDEDPVATCGLREHLQIGGTGCVLSYRLDIHPRLAEQPHAGQRYVLVAQEPHQEVPSCTA